MAKILRDGFADADFIVIGADEYPVWLTVGAFSVMLRDRDGELSVKVFKIGEEADEEIAELVASIGGEANE